MGWFLRIQIVRERPLDNVEQAALAAHALRWKLSRHSEGYRFAVAPPGGSGGVIAIASGKLARDPDPEEDDDSQRLYRALTELRALVRGATIEVADDLGVVGWDGASFGLVHEPDQTLTAAPADRDAWIAVPAARRTRAPATLSEPATRRRRPVTELPSEIDIAIAAIAAGNTASLPPWTAEEARPIAAALFSAMARAARDGKSATAREHLEAIAAQLPPLAVVEVGLDARYLSGAPGAAIGAAIARLPALDDVRDRLLDLWFAQAPGPAAERFWDLAAYHVLRPAAHDLQVVARLAASLDERDPALLRRRHQTMGVLAGTPAGIAALVGLRRRDRGRPDAERLPMIDHLLSAHDPAVVPTLLIELPRASADRDDLIPALLRFDDPRIGPVIDRVLAADQHTRAVADGMIALAGDRGGRGARAEAMFAALADHVDPLVRIRAAQALVARRGDAEIPRLLATVAAARAAGIWDGEHYAGRWGNHQLSRPADALREPRGVTGWPSALRALTADDLPPARAEPASAPARMRSPNPDVRVDALEVAHAAALRARDASQLLALVAAERLHHALCERAELPMTTRHGTTSRVSITNYWSAWRKLARIPFDPAYKHRHVTWEWLDAHAHEAAPQVIPPTLAGLATPAEVTAAAAALPAHRLIFDDAELAAWDAAEREIAG